jgi:hypothetical protein
MARKPFLLSVLAAAAALTFAVAPAQGQTLPDDFFTINGGWLNHQDYKDLRETHLENIEQSGITAVRSDLLWNVVEGLPTAAGRQIDIARYDDFVGALAEHGLTWRPVFGAAPSWNRMPGRSDVTESESVEDLPVAVDDTLDEKLGSALEPVPVSPPPPVSDASFYSPPIVPELATEVVMKFFQRYGEGGTFWKNYAPDKARPVRFIEAWNEPNLAPSDKYGLRYPPERYAHFLAAVAAGAKSVDPEAQVIVGGLVPHLATTNEGMAVREFLNVVAAAVPGVSTLTGGVGVHIYASPAKSVLTKLGEVREQVDTTPFARSPLHLNEFGGSVRTTGMTEAQRAEVLENATKLAARASGATCRIGSVAPYTWVTPEKLAADPEDWFGIADPLRGALRASALAYRSGISGAVAGDDACGKPPVLPALPMLP